MNKAVKEMTAVPRLATIARSEDRRHACRFELCAPVILSWMDKEGQRCVAAGFSRNIARAGLFVITRSDLPPLFSKVDVAVVLPSLDQKSQGMQLSSQGTVVRAVPTLCGRGLGVASRFGRLEHGDAAELLAAAPH